MARRRAGLCCKPLIVNDLGDLLCLDNLSASPYPIATLTAQALVVTQARLPSILAVLTHNKGVVHGAILYS